MNDPTTPGRGDDPAADSTAANAAVERVQSLDGRSRPASAPPRPPRAEPDWQSVATERGIVSAIRADDDLVNQLAAGEHPDPGDPLTDALNAWLERTRRPGSEGRDR